MLVAVIQVVAKSCVVLCCANYLAGLSKLWYLFWGVLCILGAAIYWELKTGPSLEQPTKYFGST